jgi:2-amino-4-hydroxy-6-hydroxymethyldihydropteridine diphosphokinase
VITADPPARAYIGLGSNLDDPIDQVRTAMGLLGGLPGTRLLGCSSYYRTTPVGLTAQPDFINAVCELATSLDPSALLQALLAIESRRGRVRDVPGGPRTLDLDLILYITAQGELVRRQEPGLTLPHARLHERAFVLYPLSELAPDLVIPGRGRVGDLLAGCAGQGIEKLAIA